MVWQRQLMAMLWVGLGGFVGANARYGLTLLALRLGTHLPLGTLAANLSGSFGLALFLAWANNRLGVPTEVRLLIGTGFFGAFTTFSTYANDGVALWRSGETATAITYVIIVNVVCLSGVILGLWIGHRL